MKTLWKEWRQQRSLVLFGICAGIIWPLIEMVGNKEWYTNWGSGVVVGGGAIFAVLLAMSTGYADLRQGIDTFWQARPIRIGRVFLVKLLVGMVLLAVTFVIVMLPDLWTGLISPTNMISLTWPAFWTTWPIAVLLFGAGLFFVALIRDMAKAAFVTIWFGLLVYFLPLFFNVLRPMNVFEMFNQDGTFFQDRANDVWMISDWKDVSWIQRMWYILKPLLRDSEYLIFLGVSLGGALAFTILAIQAVKRNWRWQPGQKTIVWTLGASAALIFAITLFQVRSDLQPATHKDGQALLNPMPLEWVEPPLPQAVKDRGNRLFFERFDTSHTTVHNEFLYVLKNAFESDHALPLYQQKRFPVYRHWVLQVYRFPFEQDAPRQEGKGVPSIPCGGLVVYSTVEKVEAKMIWPNHGCYVRGDRLYAVYPTGSPANFESRTCVSTIDISNPTQPRLVGTLSLPNSSGGGTFAIHGDYGYLFSGGQMTLLSLKQPDEPAIVAEFKAPEHLSTQMQGKLPRQLSESPEMFLPWHSLHLQAVGNRLVCQDFHSVAVLDLSEPTDPAIVYHETLPGVEGIVGPVRLDAVALTGDLLYMTTKAGLMVKRLARSPDGSWSSQQVGYRAATPLERLSGRNPFALLLYGDYLVEGADSFGVIVYDVSDPTRPRRVMYNDRSSQGIGIWNDLLYSEGGDRLTFFDLPAKAH